MEIAALVRQVAAGALLRELDLRAGSELAVRVAAAPPEGGRGLVSLAGTLLRAQLPPDTLLPLALASARRVCSRHAAWVAARFGADAPGTVPR